MDILLTGLTIYTEDETLHHANLGIANGKIVAINHTGSAEKTLHFSNNEILVPGMIDLHIHGALGADVMDATPEALATICKTLPSEGTTAFLATTMSEPKINIERALTNLNTFVKTPYLGSEIIGVHLEGPFISKKRLGAQREDSVLTPNIELFNQWQDLCQHLIKLVTLAPEEPEALAFINYLTSHKIVASLGHSDADYEQALAAIEAGCSHATHLFNAMRSLNHREPGAVTALLNSKKVIAELIVDGVHLHPAIVNLAYQLKTKHNIVLVTDAMRAKCCCDGEYTLGGQKVIVKNHEARLTNGALAGSVLTMNNAIKNMIRFTHCSIRDVMTMTAENPAKQLAIYDKKGSIKVGKDADLVVITPDYDIITTICRGVVSYNSL